MEISLTTPSLLFPAISLLMLAYTNRFLALASLIRRLHGDWTTDAAGSVARQIENLQFRLLLIRWMQVLGVASMLLCTVCMFVLFAGWTRAGEMVFGASLLLMMGSLGVSLWEIHLSGGALTILLGDMKGKA